MPKLTSTLRSVAALEMLVALAGLAPHKAAVAQSVSAAPVVKIDTGAVSGATAGGVTSFKGIPYAAAPVGALRWRIPQPVKPWPGVLKAEAFGPACMQAEEIPKSEDCLTLNVWSPAAASKRLPVMVWIYGGALMHGRTAMYPLDAIARRGVVAVSMNYRMGRFGFFAHPALAKEAPDDVRANYGYMDQLLALQWVKKNIAAFGGDPSNVTIFGESAGGGSVLVHLTSPLSRGLFHRAILQSPGVPTARAAVLPMSSLADAETQAADYVRGLGIAGDGAAALAALRALPAGRLLEGASADQELAALSAGRHVMGFAGSTRDGKLVTDAPDAILAAGKQALVPVLVGANDRDLGLGVAATKDQLFAALGSHADAARKLYDVAGDQTLPELKQQVFADRTMLEPARHLADALARAGQPVWLYRFGYVAQAQRGKLMGTPHGFEIPFTLDVPAAIVGPDNVTPTDKAMAAIVSAYWVQFAGSGDPNAQGLPAWPRHDPASDRILHVTNSGLIVGTDPLKARLDLWQKRWAANDGGDAAAAPVSGQLVTIDNFIRAESDLYFGKAMFGELRHARQMAPIDRQEVVRMNRDTLYSSGVFDLDAAPLSITLPDPGRRFMSMQIINQDHYTTEVVYAPGNFTYTRDKVGTRYVYVIIRTLVDPEKPDEVKAANALQDAIKTEQSSRGIRDLPTWDKTSQDKVRNLLNQMSTMRGSDIGAAFGARGDVDPISHLIGTAIGWGGNPPQAAIYRGYYPKQNDGKTTYRLMVKDVPVDGFWSISVYDAKGYFASNDLNRYSINNLTAKADADGAVTIQFGDCEPGVPNCLPITPGWNYTVRLYRPRPEILSGRWGFPEARPIM